MGWPAPYRTALERMFSMICSTAVGSRIPVTASCTSKDTEHPALSATGLMARTLSRTKDERLTSVRVSWSFCELIRATSRKVVARINSQKLQLTLTEVNLSSLVRDSVLAMSPVAESAGCSVSLDVQDAVTGILDQTAVEQIIENILSNAVRYGAGHPIEVSLVRILGTARLSIRDQGIGISEAEQARIFGRFQRADR